MKSYLMLFLALAIVAVNCAELKDDPVLTQESNIQADGNFHSLLETASGTKIVQDGHLKHIGAEDTEVIEGAFGFKGDDGKVYNTEYTADENGYVPRGDHIPTAPPIPPAIQRALDYVASHPHKE